MERGASAAERRIARALSLAVQQPTVSGCDVKVFEKLHTILRELFPLFFGAAETRVVDGRALLCLLSGEKNVRPRVFLSHMDVYPVRDASKWKYPPFSGTLSEGFVYGRGTADMKGHMIALLTAAEGLLEAGWRPQNDVWFAFSCDEEIRGDSMRHMCALLQAESAAPAFVMDEGGAVTRLEALCTGKAALIGVAEKGHLRFTLTAPGGDAADLLRASEKLARMRFPAHIVPVTCDMLTALSPVMTGPRRFAAAHPSLLKPLLLRDLDRTVYGRSLTRTQLAVSAMDGNALTGREPAVTFQASVLPGESARELLKRVERAIRGDGILVSVEQFDEPSMVSPATGSAWEALKTAVEVHFPHVDCAPCLLTGGSDARRMEPVCPYIYRFSPFLLPHEELARMHHADERLSVENLIRGAAFFRQMLQA